MENQYLSLIMPVYNEKNTILKSAEKALKLNILKELIIVDDGSSDGTKEILQKENLGPKVKKYFHEKNLGKGAALRTGFKVASGEIIAVQDADLEYDPEELKELTNPIVKGVADVVYGSRLTGAKPQRVYMFWHKVGNTFLSLVANIFYNTTLSDMETCYKVFRREVIEGMKLKSNGFSIEPEITAKILKKDLRVYEIPISYYGRTYKEGKKIRWIHGFGAIWALIKYKFID
ncbi:MAG: glycosyl transferase [Omnitrophica WOR_2 bacterium SM23_72]|nr:MAG: glycosyl transferase [Omnitrophica WOR_2 bacterium SM23_72]